MFDEEYGELINVVIDALATGKPTYIVPDRYLDKVVLTGKRLPVPKYNRLNDPIAMNGTVKGKMALWESRTEESQQPEK